MKATGSSAGSSQVIGKRLIVHIAQLSAQVTA